MTDDRTEEAIVAYLDGAMPADDRAAFDRRCAVEPALAQRLAAHRWLRQQIAAAYGEPPVGEVPPELVTRLGLAQMSPGLRPDSPGAGWRRHGSGGWRRALAPALAGALAASLVMTLWVAGVARGGGNAIVMQGPDGAVAAGPLAAALSDRLTDEPGAIRIAMTFRTAQGPCRTFTAAGGLHGLACRKGERWALPVLVTQPPASAAAGDYRLASGDMPRAIMAEVDRRIVGDPLAPGEERQLRKSGWR